MSSKRLLFTILTSVVAIGPIAHADEVTTSAATAATSAAALSELPTWMNRVKISGDLRLRTDREQGLIFDQGENTDERIRARLLIEGKITDKAMIGFRFTTGHPGLDGYGSQYSTNPVIGNVNGKFDFNLDLMYLAYKPTPDILLEGGKAPNIFWAAGNSELVWNYVWTLEGAAMRYQPTATSFQPFLTMAYTQLYESGATDSGRDINMLGIQIGAPVKISENFSAKAAVASYNYSNIKGTPVNSLMGGTQSNAIGNSYNGTTNITYRYDYKMIDASAELLYNFAAGPLKAYFNYVQNSDPGDMNKANLVGLKFGTLKDVGSWFVESSYRNVQKDATFAIAGESWFLGGGSDAVGALYRVGYQFWPTAYFQLEYENGTRMGQYGEFYFFDIVSSF